MKEGRKKKESERREGKEIPGLVHGDVMDVRFLVGDFEVSNVRIALAAEEEELRVGIVEREEQSVRGVQILDRHWVRQVLLHVDIDIDIDIDKDVDGHTEEYTG